MRQKKAAIHGKHLGVIEGGKANATFGTLVALGYAYAPCERAGLSQGTQNRAGHEWATDSSPVEPVAGES